MQSQINPSSGGSPQWSGGLGRLQTLSSQFESHAYYNNNKFYFFYLKIKKTCAFMIICSAEISRDLIKTTEYITAGNKRKPTHKIQPKIDNCRKNPVCIASTSQFRVTV